MSQELAAPLPLAVIVLASAALHVTVVGLMPSATTAAPHVPEPVVVVLAMAPPAPTPEPEPATPPPSTRAERPARAASALRPVARAASLSPPAEAAGPAAASSEALVDLTGTVLSNAGLVRGDAGGRGTAPGAGAATAIAKPATRTVPVADLARAPRAPALDAALERHYPADARRAGIAGRALLRVQILPSGRVGTVRAISEAHPGFARACEAAVRSAPWEPPIARDGSAVATEISYTCRFEIQG